jgi:hypothetical protein
MLSLVLSFAPKERTRWGLGVSPIPQSGKKLLVLFEKNRKEHVKIIKKYYSGAKKPPFIFFRGPTKKYLFNIKSAFFLYINKKYKNFFVSLPPNSRRTCPSWAVKAGLTFCGTASYNALFLVTRT